MSNTQLIGDKSSFAIEIEPTNIKNPYHYGKACIWIKGNKVGYFEEEIMIGTFVNALKVSIEKGLKNNENINQDFSSKHQQVFLTENFDDFSLRILFGNDKSTFSWKLLGNNYEYDEVNKKNHYLQKQIANEVILENIEKLNKTYEKLLL